MLSLTDMYVDAAKAKASTHTHSHTHTFIHAHTHATLKAWQPFHCQISLSDSDYQIR